jgi:four helix bundle protein
MIERFEDLEVWKRARALVKGIYSVTRTRYLSRDYGLSGQIQRAGVSIMSNVAEGFERTHVAEKSQFYNVARGSTAEVRSLTYVVEDNFPDLQQQAQELRQQCVEVGRLVTGLVASTERRRRSVTAFFLSLFTM